MTIARGGGVFGTRICWFALFAAVSSSPALAQVDERLDIETQIPQGYDRGRNVSVRQAPLPDYRPLGIRLGSFYLYPSLEVGAGGTTNTYLSSDNEKAAPLLTARAAARLTSGWARHDLTLSGNVDRVDYLGESRRNERTWDLRAQGRVELGSRIEIEANGQASRNVESRFSGEVNDEVAALSRVRRDFGSLQATYTQGRIRAFIVGDYAEFDYNDVPLTNGEVIDQSDRNRSIARLTGQIEYARSPGLAFFAQVAGADTSYENDLISGLPNIDSKALRVVGGANFDLSGKLRGSVGLGYSVKEFDADIYDSVKGLSVDTRVEFFPSRLFTVTFDAQRTIEDSSLRQRNPFWRTQFALTGDYALLHNLILTSTARYSHQDFTESDTTSETYGASIGGRYLGSRRASIEGALSYRTRKSNDATFQRTVNEGRFTLAFRYQI
jgi:hypothetical protein